jgi:hypothetical protein
MAEEPVPLDVVQESSAKAIYDQPQTWFIQDQVRFPIPAGTGRCLVLEDWTSPPVYLKFGPSTVSASFRDTRLDYGRAQYLIPDDATHVALSTSPARSILAKFGYAER